MTIQELASRARVTPRTIRYYVDQGILPPPGRGRPAEYTEEHLQRLDLIRRLKEQYLPLEEIRDTMLRLSMREIEELLETHTPSGPVRSRRPSSAADYVASVLGQGAAREEKKRRSTTSHADLAQVNEVSSRYSMPKATAPAEELTYSLREESPSPAYAPPPAPSAAPPSPAGLPAARTLKLDAPEVERRDHLEGGGTWQRIPVAPGIELHVALTGNPSIDVHNNRIVARLIDAAQGVPEQQPEKGIEEK